MGHFHTTLVVLKEKLTRRMQNFLWSCWAGGSWTIRRVPSQLCTMKIIKKLKMRILLIVFIHFFLNWFEEFIDTWNRYPALLDDYLYSYHLNAWHCIVPAKEKSDFHHSCLFTVQTARRSNGPRGKCWCFFAHEALCRHSLPDSTEKPYNAGNWITV